MANPISQMKPPKIPKFWLSLPKDARLACKDIYAAFGYKNMHSFSSAVSYGHFPNADNINRSELSYTTNGRREWLVSTLIREARRRNELLKGGDK
jgi:hypothetical protein